MTESVQADAAALLGEVEKVSAVILPEPAGEVVPLEQATPDQAQAIKTRMAEVDLSNTQSIISFGSSAQAAPRRWKYASMARAVPLVSALPC